MNFDQFIDFELAWRYRQERVARARSTQERAAHVLTRERLASPATWQNPVSLAYLFSVLDVSGQQALTEREVGAECTRCFCPPALRLTRRTLRRQLAMFSREVQALWVENGRYGVPVSDVVHEIFDMTVTRERVTLADLVRTGVGVVVVGMLSSLSAFAEYDERENYEAADVAAPS